MKTYREYLNEVNNKMVAKDGYTFKCPLFTCYHYGDMCEIHTYYGCVYYGNDLTECINNIYEINEEMAERVANVLLCVVFWEVQ